ncbi:hypothetical protein KSF_049170 [Reticulibacter mediterranei]|uniref:Uncharacterized protein n=1 Tax=Reticulibacter mediterranei TaxID=2778369 RepID=A0A8J3N159_9CHLR|nr:hypothetical protein [Reticulibacter mediterranei]GHO94869.1 hypothetical protein KSF_049170 [Reticulibacter mediterranei]
MPRIPRITSAGIEMFLIPMMSPSLRPWRTLYTLPSKVSLIAQIGAISHLLQARGEMWSAL